MNEWMSGYAEWMESCSAQHAVMHLQRQRDRATLSKIIGDGLIYNSVQHSSDICQPNINLNLNVRPALVA